MSPFISVGQPLNLILNSQETGTQNHQARKSIEFLSGYDYVPGSGIMTASIVNGITGTVSYGAVVDPDARSINTGYLVGATEGSFSVNPLGQATYSIPIDLPEGVNGLKPDLSLNYSSMAGPGVAGYGWQIGGISAISRAPQTIFQDGQAKAVTGSHNDRFALDGQRLVCTSGTYAENNSQYRTDQDIFTRVTMDGTFYWGTVQFKAETKSGHIFEYGYTAESILRSGFGWYVSSVSDLHGNRMNYYYLNKYGNVYPSVIEYGPYQVIFYYKERTDIINSYFNDSQSSQKLLLDKIEISYNNNVIKTYQLKYNLLSNNYYGRSALNEIEEFGTGGSRLNSTAFKYQQPGNMYLSYPSFHSQNDISTNSVLYPGDFNGDGKDDIFALEVTTTNHRAWKLYINTIYGFVLSDSGTSGDYIDTVIPTDLNADGKTDIIYTTASDNWNFYRYMLSNGDTFQGCLTIRRVNPYYGFCDPKYKYSADFDGDGINDCMVKEKYPTTPPTNYWYHSSTYFDNSIHSYLGGEVSGTIESWGNQDWVGDFNGDGKTDLWTVNSSGLKIYTFNGSSFNLLYSNSWITNLHHFNVGDFNGDGKMDILVYGNGASDWTTWQIHIATGFSFTTTYIPAKKSNLKDDNVYTGDFNGDGRTDILAFSTNTSGNPRQYCFISNLNGNDFYSQYTEYSDLNKNYSYTLGDYDGNGKTDIIVTSGTSGYKIVHADCNNDMLMTSIGDGLGNNTHITYSKLSEPGAHYTKDETGDNFPVSTYQGPLNVVQTVIKGYDENHLYEYEGLKLHHTGKGLLCFTKITDTEYISGNIVEYQYSYDPVWFYPRLASTTTRHGSNNMSVVTNGYSNIELNTSSGTRRVFPYIHTTSEQNILTGQTISSTADYDLYGNVTSLVKDYGTRTESTTNTVVNIDNSTQWLLGRVTNSSTTYTGTGSPITKQINRSYQSTTNLVETETYYPSTASQLVKSYEYYTSGNLKKETITGESDRITQYEYDSNNIRVTKITDPLGHETNKTYNTYGLLASETDYLNNSVSYTYDNLFRPNLQTNSDGSTTTTTLNWAGGAGPSNACYYQQKAGNDGAVSKVWFDKQGREIRKDVKGFNGNMVAALKSYNYKGQLESESEPYYDTGSPSQYHTYTYDDYGRPLGISHFTGSSTSYSYSGNTVTETTNGDDFAKTYNADGTLAQATDHGGTLTYTYYPDGKAYTISKDGNTVTTLSYDIAGNKTQMVDNSAGTIIDTYTKFGELKTRTNARGELITINYLSDGRLDTKVTPEGTTTYSYNGNKQLTGITSPGSISRSQSYDSKGRVQNITETIDSNPYSTTFAYDAIGRLDTRTHPSGIVEKNDYNNSGYLYQTLADNQVVWTIGTMDERQHVRTASYGNGTLNATLGFDSYGLPNSSVVTGVQNYSYSFDPVRGNLTWRKNEVNGIQEDFTYDNLDRLRETYRGGILFHQTSFDSSGNITGKSDFGATYSYNTPNKPNAVSDIATSPVDLPNTQNLSFTSFEKAGTISEGAYSAEFVYNAEYERAKMTVKNNNVTFLTRLYAGSRYMKETLNGTDSQYTYLGGDAYSAPVVAVTTGGSTIYYYLIRDYLGNITHVYNSSNSTTREYSYDAWGRRRNAADWSYDLTGQPELLADRGFTSHEHLPWFNLINMNGRLYDPLVGAFVSPDPNIQMPDHTQGLNRYTYCMNNPLLYVDPSGYTILSNFGHWIGKNWKSIVTIATTIAVVAVVTVATAGMGTLAAGAIVGGAGGFASGSLGSWLNGGSFLQGMGAGAINGIIGAIGGIASGAAVGFVSKNVTGFALNSLHVAGKSAIGGLISGGLGGVAGGAVGGFVTGLIMTGDFDKALEMAGQGAIYGGIAGAVLGGYRGFKDAKALGNDPWTGQARSDNLTKAFGIDGTLKRISNGESYPHRNDGSIFKNKEGFLPDKPYGGYKEYVHPTQGIQGPGVQRIIIGNKGEIYYSPDHYETFIKIY